MCPPAHRATPLVTLTVRLLPALLALAALSFGRDAATAGIAVIGPLVRDNAVQAGTTFEGGVELRNTGNAAQDVRLYQTDYVFAAEGSNRYDPVGSHARSNGPWLTVSPTVITVPPRQTVVAQYRGTVPPDATLAGTYWSAIMVEPQGALDQTVPGGEGVKASLRTTVRYAVQIATEVGPPAERKIRFLDKRIIEEDGRRLLQVDVENIGQRFLAPGLWAEFYDSSGNKKSRLQSAAKRIYPGCSVRHLLDVTELPTDRYRVLLVLDNGDESVFGAQYTVKLGR